MDLHQRKHYSFRPLERLQSENGIGIPKNSKFFIYNNLFGNPRVIGSFTPLFD